MADAPSRTWIAKQSGMPVGENPTQEYHPKVLLWLKLTGGGWFSLALSGLSIQPLPKSSSDNDPPLAGEKSSVAVPNG